MKGVSEGITDNFEMTVVRADLPYQNKKIIVSRRENSEPQIIRAPH